MGGGVVGEVSFHLDDSPSGSLAADKGMERRPQECWCDVEGRLEEERLVETAYQATPRALLDCLSAAL